MSIELVTNNLEEYQSKLEELGFGQIKVIGYRNNYCGKGHKKLILKQEDFETEYMWSELRLGKTLRLSQRYRLSKVGMLKYCADRFPNDDIVKVNFLNPEKKAHGSCNFVSRDGRDTTLNLHTVFGKHFNNKDSLFDTIYLTKKEVLDKVYSLIDKDNVVEVIFDKHLYNPLVKFIYAERNFSRRLTTLERSWQSTIDKGYYHTKESIIETLKVKFGITNIEILNMYNCPKSKKTRLKLDIRCIDTGKVVHNVDSYKMLNRGYWFTTISSGEHMLQIYFEENNIKYTFQKTFHNLRDKALLRFDFYLDDFRTCVEFDGDQHFRPVEAWGGQEKLEDTQYKDELKNKYCKDNDISLIRIPYWKLRNLDNLNKYFKDIVSPCGKLQD